MLLMTFVIIIMAPIMMVGGVVMALQQDVPLSALLLVVVPLLAAVMGLAALRLRPLFRQMQERLDRINLVLREQIQGVRVIRSFNRQGTERDRFAVANDGDDHRAGRGPPDGRAVPGGAGSSSAPPRSRSSGSGPAGSTAAGWRSAP